MHVAPAGTRLVGLLVIPRTMLPGGRGPRSVAPVRCAGRSAAHIQHGTRHREHPWSDRL